MVEVMRSPSLGQIASGSVDMMEAASRFADMKLEVIHETNEPASHESRKQQGGELKKGALRVPRRAFSSNDYQLPGSGPGTPTGYFKPAATPSPSSRPSETESYFSPRLPTPNSHPSIPSSPTDPQQSVQVSRLLPPNHGPAKRPALHSPQRSYSVMDHEPVSILQLPGEALQLIHLPVELHYAIFDFLDPMDSACLGLTSMHFYAIHRRLHGSIPLSVRREGPNDMEWAWRLAGPLIASGHSQENAMNMVLPRGQVYCRKCGISRCELHKHIQDWMGKGYEYCEVRQKFGPVAAENARKSCYRSSPRHPRRCGRHAPQQRAVRLV